ncbi:MAG: deoxyribose-phosphate aldolase [Bernardetiaceae bacterium]
MIALHPYLEHTYLQPDISDARVEEMVAQAIQHRFVGLCLPPYWIKKARRDLGQSTEVQLVTVIGFPLGYQRTEAKLAEITCALQDGADEVDVVMNYSAFCANPHWVKVEWVRCAQLVHQTEKLIKVILETESLTEEQVALAARLARDAGVDFVKTSTGWQKGDQQRKLHLVKQLRQWLPDYVGIKASGGIRTRAEAEQFIAAGAERIGTSAAVAMVSDAV